MTECVVAARQKEPSVNEDLDTMATERSSDRATSQRLSRWWAAPEAPLAALFVGFPIWWLFGVVQIAFAMTAAIMVARMLPIRRIRAPRGFGLWLLFLATAFLGVFVVQAEAPGTVTGANPYRYFTWGIRILWYLEATIVLIYIANMGPRLSLKRVSRTLSVMFIYVVIGGLIGSLAPELSIHSVLEMMLPRGLTSNAFVQSLVHPTFAERQVYLDTVQFRPSAPFPYANEWGLNFACLLPVFVYTWLGRDAKWRRIAAPIVLLAAVVPVIYSLNRGLWAVIVLLLLVTAVKQARSGHYRLVALLVTAVAIAAVVVSLSPLSQALLQRFEGHNSNEGRVRLGLMTVEAVLHSSPIIGLGTTRDVQGAFYSIAGGSTPNCPSCSPPALGTQGFGWLLVFCYGAVGAVFALSFLLRVLWRYRAVKQPMNLAYYCAMLSFVLTLAIYDWSVTAAFTLMIAISANGITADLRRSSNEGSGKRDLQEFHVPITFRQAVAGCALGATLGFTWQLWQGPTYLATSSIWFSPIEADARVQNSLETTLDTRAEYLNTPNVRVLFTTGADAGWWPKREKLVATAPPNTQVLNLTYSSSSPARAVQVVSGVAHQLVVDDEARTNQRRLDTLRSLDAEMRGAQHALEIVDNRLASIERNSTSSANTMSVAAMKESRADLYAHAQELAKQKIAITSSTSQGRAIPNQPVVRLSPSRWNVAIASGALLGLLGTVLWGQRARRRTRASAVDLLQPGESSDTAAPTIRFSETRPSDLVAGLMVPTRTTTVLSIDPGDVRLHLLAQRCEILAQKVWNASGEITDRDHSRIVLLARSTTHVDEILVECRKLSAAGLRVQGVGVCIDV